MARRAAAAFEKLFPADVMSKRERVLAVDVAPGKTNYYRTSLAQ